MDDSKQTALNAQTEASQKNVSESLQNLAGESLASKAVMLASEMKKPRVPLPDGVLRRLENFNEDLRRQAWQHESTDKSTENYEQDFPSLYKRARRFTDQLDEEKKGLYDKSKKNFKLFLILLLLFGVYFFYTANFTDKTALAITSLRQQLPLQFDKDTALTAVELSSTELRLYVKKNAEIFAGFDDQAKAEAIARFSVNASPLCRNEAMHKIIAEGKRILVLLDADDGSFHREIVIEKCPQPE